MHTPLTLAPSLGSELVDFWSPEEPEERSSTDSSVDSFSMSLWSAGDIVNLRSYVT